MSDYHADLFQAIRNEIRQMLREWRPNLAQTTGTLPGTQLPPTGNTGGGYTPAPHVHDGSDITTGTIADARIAATIARLSDLTWANVSGKPTTFTPSAHTHDGAAITTGIVADARIAATIARLGVAQTWTADQAFSEHVTLNKLLTMPLTASGNGYGIRFGDGSTNYGNFQALDLGGIGYLFFSANRQFDGTAWQSLNARAGSSLQVQNDELAFATFAAGSTSSVQRLRLVSGGALWLGGASGGPTGAGQLWLNSGTAVALRVDGSANTATTAGAAAGKYLIINNGGTLYKIALLAN